MDVIGIDLFGMRVTPSGKKVCEALSNARDSEQRVLFVMHMVGVVVLSLLNSPIYLGDACTRGLYIGCFGRRQRGWEHFLQQGSNCCDALKCCVLGVCVLIIGLLTGVAAAQHITIPLSSLKSLLHTQLEECSWPPQAAPCLNDSKILSAHLLRMEIIKLTGAGNFEEALLRMSPRDAKHFMIKATFFDNSEVDDNELLSLIKNELQPYIDLDSTDWAQQKEFLKAMSACVEVLKRALGDIIKDYIEGGWLPYLRGIELEGSNELLPSKYAHITHADNELNRAYKAGELHSTCLPDRVKSALTTVLGREDITDAQSSVKYLLGMTIGNGCSRTITAIRGRIKEVSQKVQELLSKTPPPDHKDPSFRIDQQLANDLLQRCDGLLRPQLKSIDEWCQEGAKHLEATKALQVAASTLLKIFELYFVNETTVILHIMTDAYFLRTSTRDPVVPDCLRREIISWATSTGERREEGSS